MPVKVKRNCKMDIEEEIYEAVRLYARVKQVDFDCAINTLLHFAFDVHRLSDGLELSEKRED